MAKNLSFSDQMRKLIKTNGRSCYRISKETGIDTSTISRFLHAKGGMSIEGLDAIAACLGWTIHTEKVEPEPASKPRKAGK